MDHRAASLANCMYHAYKDGDLSPEHIIQLWYVYYADDRRFKVFFNAVTRDTYLIRVGTYRYLVVFFGGRAYCRPCTREDFYDLKPCFKSGVLTEFSLMATPAEFQFDVLI